MATLQRHEGVLCVTQLAAHSHSFNSTPPRDVQIYSQMGVNLAKAANKNADENIGKGSQIGLTIAWGKEYGSGLRGFGEVRKRSPTKCRTFSDALRRDDASG